MIFFISVICTYSIWKKTTSLKKALCCCCVSMYIYTLKSISSLNPIKWCTGGEENLAWWLQGIRNGFPGCHHHFKCHCMDCVQETHYLTNFSTSDQGMSRPTPRNMGRIRIQSNHFVINESLEGLKIYHR